MEVSNLNKSGNPSADGSVGHGVLLKFCTNGRTLNLRKLFSWFFLLLLLLVAELNRINAQLSNKNVVLPDDFVAQLHQRMRVLLNV